MPRPRSRRLAAGVGVSLLFLAVARWAPAPWAATVRNLVLALLALKLISGLPAAIRRVRNSKNSSGSWTHALHALLPDWVRRMVRVETAVYREATCAMLGRRRPSARCMERQPSGLRFTLHRGPISSVFLPLIVLASLVELPFLHLLIHVNAPEAHREQLHFGLVFITLWGVFWAVGDRSAVEHIQHLVVDQVVRLQVGFRASCNLPISCIEEVRRVKGRPREWMSALGINRCEVAVISPMDAPNLLVCLTDDRREVQWMKWGSDRAAVRYVAVYVDDAALFQQTILRRKEYMNLNRPVMTMPSVA